MSFIRLSPAGAAAIGGADASLHLQGGIQSLGQLTETDGCAHEMVIFFSKSIILPAEDFELFFNHRETFTSHLVMVRHVPRVPSQTRYPCRHHTIPHACKAPTVRVPRR